MKTESESEATATKKFLQDLHKRRDELASIRDNMQRRVYVLTAPAFLGPLFGVYFAYRFFRSGGGSVV
jgi:hypothetical protein